MYRTTVRAIDDDVRIFEFGAFGWHNGKWYFSTIYNRPFNAEEFAEWYSCPNATVSKAKSCNDPKNYSVGDQLSSVRSKWYFIGTNTKVQKVKGEAVVESLAKVGK